ncbi:MAG TPA: tRNA (adenosine(37)-N6)-threonylcarbamoyltransferase complex ATPase subunit type 1 TsaE, partial [Candidatus Saccharimonadales bacterium]
MTTKLILDSAEQTFNLGKALGANLIGGEVIELVSDLGGGKTTLTKGIALGAGSQELVSSPSFTICNEYACPKFKIYHFDFYRLNDPGIIKRELAEVIDDPDKVVVIEWPEAVENILPQKLLTVSIKTTEQNAREVTLSYPKELEYLT